MSSTPNDSNTHRRGEGGRRASGEFPSLAPHDLLEERGWRSPWFANLVLQTELQLRQAPESLLELAAQLEDADLYPGAMDLIVATAHRDVAPRMHAFYAGRGPTLPQALTGAEIQRLDRAAHKLAARLHLAALRVDLRCMNNPLLHRPLVVRDVLQELGVRLARPHPHQLPRVRPVTEVPEDDPTPFFPLSRGRLLDRRSGLTWRNLRLAPRGTREEAEIFLDCQSQDGGDWDLPTRRQLGTLRGTPGLPNDWVWLKEEGRSWRYGWCGRVQGEMRQVLTSWPMKVWLVQPKEGGCDAAIDEEER